MVKELTFTIEQLVAVQNTLRETLDSSPVEFPLQAFIGMISDEIEQLRVRGMSDEDIAALVVKATSVPVSGDAIRLYYTPPEARRH